MQINKDISTAPKAKLLKDFIPLVLAFFCGLTVLSLYQNIRLYINDVLDNFFNVSFLLLLLHHIGYASVAAIVLVFLFRHLERKVPGLGYKSVSIIFIVLLCVEGFLIEYFIKNLEPLGANILNTPLIFDNSASILVTVMVIVISIGIANYLLKYLRFTYNAVSKMYPFTIVLLSLFLATLYTSTKPVNENKTQFLVTNLGGHLLNSNVYKGEKKFPLLKPSNKKSDLAPFFKFKEEKPSFIFILVEGLGKDFVGDNSKYKAYSPFLNSISKESLYWPNFLSNTGESHAAMPSVIGSLPFGNSGFTNVSKRINRHSIYTILKENGYETSFNYGGNSSLNSFDKFLKEEGVENIIDRKVFSPKYKQQNKDNAGISLGYPDYDLFENFRNRPFKKITPSVDVFLTLSSRKPYLIPNKEVYVKEVKKILSEDNLSAKNKKIVEKNNEIFASMLYTDSAIASFISALKTTTAFENTIIVITGTHNGTDLNRTNNLKRYQVPLIIYSPLLRVSHNINTLASHVDIVPSLASMLKKSHNIETPSEVAWLGDYLYNSKVFREEKEIPLFRSNSTIRDYIVGNVFLSDNDIYTLDEKLNRKSNDSSVLKENAIKKFRYFKSVNKYVISKNRIIPKDDSLLAENTISFSKEELVWLQSVFNGNDYDDAYFKARSLAFKKKWGKALLLCKYILYNIPRHVDTEILIGRIHSWKGDYLKSAEILEKVVLTYPNYADGYAALLDTYYWSNINYKAKDLMNWMLENNIEDENVTKKLKRSIEFLKNNSSNVKKESITTIKQDIAQLE